MSPTAGVVCRRKIGEQVREGDVVLELHVDDPARLPAALDALTDAFAIGDNEPAPTPLILDRIGP